MVSYLFYFIWRVNMCGPIAVAAVYAGMTALQISQERKAANNQIAFQEKTAKLAFKNANEQQSALQSQANQVQAAANEQAQAISLQQAQEVSQVRNATGEAGVTGSGVNRLVGNIGNIASTQLGALQKNTLGQVNQINSNIDAVQGNLQGTINQMSQRVAKPGALDSIARIGASALGGYAMGASMVGAGGAAASGATGATGAAGGATGGAGAAAGSSGGFFDYMSEFFNSGMTPADSSKLNLTRQTGYTKL